MPPPQPHKAKTDELDPDDFELEIRVNGVDYFFRKSDMTSRHEMELNQQSGGALTLGKLIVSLDPVPPPFAIAGLIFLSLKQLSGDPINRKRAMKARFEKILGDLDYNMDVEIIRSSEDDDEETDEDVSRPEAVGGSGESMDQSSPTGSESSPGSLTT